MKGTATLDREIALAIQSVGESGFCVASWQPEVIALATPLQAADATYSLNLSVSTDESVPVVSAALGTPLLELKESILGAMARRSELEGPHPTQPEAKRPTP